MNKRIRMFFYAMMIVLLALISAFSVIPARADDGAPPPPAAPAAPAVDSASAPSAPAAPGSSAADTAASAPSEPAAPASADNAVAPAPSGPAAPTDTAPANPAPTGVAPSDAAPTDAPTDVAPAVPTDVAPAVDVAPTAAAPAAQTNAAAVDTSQLPDGTNVVVLNAAGDSVPMASQEAASIVANGDPMWCPTGTNPGGAGCTGSFSSFSSLLSVISAKTVPGTIWIETTYNSSGEGGSVTIDGSTLGTTQNFALTLKGGWNGSLGGASAITGTSTFNNVPLSINWNADVTLSDIVVTGLTDGASTALDIETPASITLTRVNVHDNAGDGAYLDNRNGTKTAKSVTITSSQFNTNLGPDDGLGVFSWGAITVSSLTASSNTGGGAWLDNCNYNNGISKCDTVTAQPVTLTGTNTFSNNGANYDGLDIRSLGNISVTGITANNNGANGVWLENYYKNFSGVNSTGTIALAGNNTFNNNYYDGMDAISNGAITTNSITADNNGTSNTNPGDINRGGVGAWLENDMVGAAAVTMTGTNEFNGNYAAYWNNGTSVYDPSAGLVILSHGAITANNLMANNNAAGSGAILDNCEQTSGTCATVTAQNVTLTGVNAFSGNHITGLEIDSKGVITTNNVTAASNATGWGEYLENDYTGATGGITVSGINSHSGNWFDGLAIFSHGAITVNSVTSTGNAVSGDPGSYGVDAVNNGAGLVPFTMTGTNNLGGNLGGGGLFVLSKGIITINNLTANGNTHGYGAQLNNTFSTAATPQAVTFSGLNQFNGNYYDGLNVSTYGAVTLAGVIANGNGTIGSGTTYGYGVYVNNRGNLTLLPDVTVTGTNQFNSNWLNGLDIFTNGNISLASVTANVNGLTLANSSYGYGAYLNNCDLLGTGPCTNLTPKAISLTGTNNMSGNYNTGLFVNSKGAINLTGVTASTNTHGFGAQLINTYQGITLPQAVTFSGISQFNGNYYDGLNVSTYGAVTLAGITANGNGTLASGNGYGVYVNNRGNQNLLPDVNATGVNQFNGNWLNGLDVFTNGNISLASVTALNNGLIFANPGFGYGVFLNNCDLSGTGPCTNLTAKTVTLSGTNNLSGNYNTGLFVKSKGAINLAGVTASSNTHGYGAQLINTFLGITLPQAVTFSGVSQFNGNYYDGLNVSTYGVVTLASVTANGNGTFASGTTYGYGVYVNNRGNLTALPDVNATGTNQFSNNWLDGLNILTNGNITLASVTATNNGLGQFTVTGYNYGLYLNNCDLAGSGPCTNLTPKAISLTGTNNLSGNFNSGLWVISKGIINVNSLTANSNTYGYGAVLNNTFLGTLLPQAVTFTGINQFNTNYHDGLYVSTYGAITLNSVSASFNSQGGAVLLNNGGSAQPVTLTGTNIFSHNLGVAMDGLYIASKGAINVSNVTADNNSSSWGAFLDNCNWTGTVCATLTAQPINLTGTNEFNFNGGPAGLQFASRGAISVNNITASNNNGGPGMFLEGTLSGPASPQNLTLTGYGVFNNNWDNGLDVRTYGAIALANITANNNGQSGSYGYGAYLNNYGNDGGFSQGNATAAMSVAISGTSQFNTNLFNGLFITSKGSITLSNIDAIGNHATGAYLDNTFGTLGVTLTGVNEFSENNGRGLDVVTNGAISASNLIADANAGRGAWLDNCKAYLDLVNDDCTTANVMPVTLTGSSEFKFNDGGLRIVSNGAITTNNITTSNNFPYSGAWISNELSTAGSAVTMNGTNIFNDNGSGGIYVYSRGIITLYNVTASGNGGNGYGYGAELYNNYGSTPKAVNVIISGSNIDNNFFNNYSGGLLVNSLGAITVTDLGGQSNTHGDGAFLDNNYPNAVGGITINGWGGFGGNSGYGIEAYSKGAITAASMWGWGNGSSGALLNNTYGTGVVTIGTLTSTAYASFGNNGGDGLEIYSKGAITLYNVTGDNNGGNGAFLENDTGGTAAVSINNTPAFSPSFNYNQLTGLIVKSLGTITIMDVDADGNGQKDFYISDHGGTIDHTVGYGMQLDNHLGTGNVVIGTSRANWWNDMSNNFQSGLVISSSGSVTLSNMSNDGNGGYFNITGFVGGVDQAFGATIDNHTGSLKPVVLNGSNEFNNNYDGGLAVSSRSAITVNNLTANDSGDGAYLDNTAGGPGVQQNVMVTGYGNFSNDYNTGLEVQTFGAITLNNINANTNGVNGSSGYGVLLNNSGGTLAEAVMVNGGNNFGNNYDGGLKITSKGAITVNSLDASNNTHGFGVSIDNQLGAPGTGVTVTGGAFTGNNFTYGMQVLSRGAINFSLTDSWAGNNGTYGWSLDNHFPGSVGGITLTVSSSNSLDFDQNGTYGLWAQSLGSITTTNLQAWSNYGGFGATLDNSLGGPTVTVTLNNPSTLNNNFGRNAGAGLVINSHGAIVINSLDASNNAGSGVVLDNTYSGSGSPQNVTLNGFGNFYNNGNDGLNVHSYGVITLNNLNATNNGQNNFYNLANTLAIDPNNGWGVYLDNCNLTSGPACLSTTPKGITLNGANTFNSNFQDGLWATSLGPISGVQLHADANGGDGVYLDNQWVGGTGGITVTSTLATGWNIFTNNGQGYFNSWPSGWNSSSFTSGDGLEVNSNGAITLNDIMADSNAVYGAHVDTADHTNPYAAGAQKVTFTGRNQFQNNGGDGLDVLADGDIALNNLTVYGNGGDFGTFLNNCLFNGAICQGHGTITLTGVNSFNSNNNGDGLRVWSHGNIVLNNVTADNNHGNGVNGTSDGTILVSCGSMNGNGAYGWQFWSPLTITLKGVTAFGNHSPLGNHNTLVTSGTLLTFRSCP